MQGDDVLDASVGAVLAHTETILESLPAMVEAGGVDALMFDTVQFYAELGAIKLGIPYLHISAAMHFDYTGYTPLSLYNWSHETTPQALARNREGVARFVKRLQKHNGGIRAFAKDAGIEVDWENPDSTLSPLASISQTPRAFDFESSNRPSQFRHTGPLHDGNGREPVDFPWERLTNEPLVYASMGTLLNGRVDVFRTIVAALAKHKDKQLVLSIGDNVDPEQVGPVPKNAVIVKQAPQLELLKQACLCITHAGLNTVLESLAQGVPQVAIPVSYDQPGVAARIAEKETGLLTSLDKLTAGHLSELVDEVVTDSSYQANAQKLRMAITQANGLSLAADLVEESLGVTTNPAARLGQAN